MSRRAIVTRFPGSWHVVMLRDGHHVRTAYTLTRWGAGRVARRHERGHT